VSADPAFRFLSEISDQDAPQTPSSITFRTLALADTASDNHQFACPRRFRVLNIVDDGTRLCLKAKAMTLSSDEFIRRFLLHVLPRGFHRIKHYVCLPAPPARPASRWRANSWTLQRRPMMTHQTNRATFARRVPAAVDG
jgi:hypothetical protein